MLDSPLRRALLLCLVLGAQVGLLLWGGAVATELERPYVNENALVAHGDAYVNEEVAFGASVVATDPLVVAESVDGAERRLTVVDADADARVGDHLVVYGMLETPERVRAVRAYTVPQTGLWYTYGVSTLAGLWVLARLVRGWRVDTERWGLAPRRERDA
jgi:hypothetical protein